MEKDRKSAKKAYVKPTKKASTYDYYIGDEDDAYNAYWSQYYSMYGGYDGDYFE